jgi:glycosyltransferase involved in cell wall biosynthesis
MKVLIINHFDKLPGENFRDQRYTFLYNNLKRVSDVTWISSDFHHWSHKKRFVNDLSSEDRKNIHLIKTLPYFNNVSIKRFISHSLVSLKTFLYLIKSKERYDVMMIIAPVENLFLSAIYAKITKTRLIIDILDLWPDLFEQAFPKKLNFLAKFLLYPFHKMANFAYKRADHITSVSQTYTRIGMQRGGRDDKDNSSFYYLGAPSLNFSYNTKKSHRKIKCLFAGQFGHNYDIELILEVAKKFQKNQVEVEFKLAGAGAKLQYIEDFIENNNLKNVELLGWLDSEQLLSAAKDCHIGLNCYKLLATQSVPTKIFDYMSLGLVVVNSLSGEIKDMIETDKSGVSYLAENLDSLHDSILKLIEHPQNLIKLGESNKNLFEKKYSFKVVYRDMVDNIILNIN